MTRTMTALFDTRGEAQAAMTKLVEAGVPTAAIHLLPEEGASPYQRSGTASYDYAKDEGGFWGGLKNLFIPEDDRASYAEGMSRGGVTLSVQAEDGQADTVGDILEGHAADIDEREASWRQEGWKGYEAPAASAAAPAAVTASTYEPNLRTSGNSAAYAAAGRAASVKPAPVDTAPVASGTAVDGDQVISLAEETLRVGKREVSGGRVRVRSYVVETPVNEQVSLHQERVTIDRQAVDRPLEAGTLDPFRERTIEMEETSQEAVVSKDVRVTEELHLDKTATERTQTVSDTVRRTEVEVVDERTGQTVEGQTARSTNLTSPKAATPKVATPKSATSKRP